MYHKNWKNIDFTALAKYRVDFRYPDKIDREMGQLKIEWNKFNYRCIESLYETYITFATKYNRDAWLLYYERFLEEYTCTN